MPALHFHQWMKFYELFPFGDMRDDWRMGTIGAILINSNRRQGSPAVGPADLMLPVPKTKKQREAELRASLRAAGKAKKR